MPHWKRVSVAALLGLAALLLWGCEQRPSDPRVPTVAVPADPAPVILVPGAEASTLATPEGDLVWAAGAAQLLDPRTFERLSRPLTPGGQGGERFVPTDIIRSVLGTDYYGGMIESLEQRVGGPCVLPEAIEPQTSCVLFPWDWRLDLNEAAARLDRLINRLREAKREPDLRVDLIAHSAGGIVVRYFIRFGARNVLDDPPERVQVDFAGAGKVRRAALIAVPNDGTLFGLGLMMRGHRVGMVELRPELIAVMPGAYQVMPHPDRPWLIDSEGRPLARDLYDPATWRILEQSIFAPEVMRRVREGPDAERRLAALQDWFALALERGRRMQLALSRRVAQPFGYDLFAGDCTPTPARFVEERSSGRARLRFAPEEIEAPQPGLDYAALMQRSGDGWVTRGSALGREAGAPPFRVDNAVFGCLEHAAMPAEHSVRHTLLGLLALADKGPDRARPRGVARGLIEH